ncbi:hypothetical protein HU200_066542 [Digitaria exilis]|uniref:Glycosyltransferase n=1 Tax=Digitaria exilis TaxID=1010633 RepID=A0A835A231_9POAL|nr:hypothetical protein HU200_066542 [Digitaria exilis]
MASSARPSKKLRILLMPFFVTSHINPFTELAFHLAAARPDVVEVTIAVTPANESIVRSTLARCGASHGAAAVEVATYAFPAVDGLPSGVENHSAAKGPETWRIISVAGRKEALMRPGQESLIREIAPDAIISDMHFFWNADVAADLGVPCLVFHVMGTFAMQALVYLENDGVSEAVTDGVVTLPHFPAPDIRVPFTELPEMLKSKQSEKSMASMLRRCFGLAVNTFFDLEHGYCELYKANGYVKRDYFVGPLSLPSPPQAATANNSQCIDWLDKQPGNSVVYLCFGTFVPISDAQLREVALGLEASGTPFLWVVRSDSWAPPEGWTERVGDRGLVITAWAPQTAILAHPAVGAFITHCGWNSVLETVVAGVPVLTWPILFEQFISERFVTQVLGIGERLWPEGAGVRSTRYHEHELVPAEAVARAIATFMEPGSGRDAARKRVKELSVKAHAAMADGGSSYSDLRRLIHDLIEARSASAGTTP